MYFHIFESLCSYVVIGLGTEWQQQLTQFDLLTIYSSMKFWFVVALPKGLNRATSELLTAPLNNADSFFFSLQSDSLPISGYENILHKSLSAPPFFLPINPYPANVENMVSS